MAHRNATPAYRELASEDISAIKILHDASFPITYNDQFYRSLLDLSSCSIVSTVGLSNAEEADEAPRDTAANDADNEIPTTPAIDPMMAAIPISGGQDGVIGVCTARIGVVDDTTCCFGEIRRVGYVMTLAVCRPWRRRGVGRRLMLIIEDVLADNHNCDLISLHTQCSNDAARSFYESLGYIRRRRIPDYYDKVTRGSRDAFRYEKIIGGSPSDGLDVTGGVEDLDNPLRRKQRRLKRRRRGTPRLVQLCPCRGCVQAGLGGCRDAAVEFLVGGCLCDEGMARSVASCCIVPMFIICLLSLISIIVLLALMMAIR